MPFRMKGPPSLFFMRDTEARWWVLESPQFSCAPSCPTLTHARCCHGDPGEHNLRDALHCCPLQAKSAGEPWQCPPPNHIPIPRLTLERPSSLLFSSVTVIPLMTSLKRTGSRERKMGWPGKHEDTEMG